VTVGKPLQPRDRLMVALDVPNVAAAEALVRKLGDSVGFFKIGLQLVFAGGLPFAEKLAKEGHNVFLDVKLLDIGNTVGKAVESIAALGVRLATVHAYPQAMRAAVVARAHKPLGLLGVTVLTSMDQNDFAAAGYSGPITDRVVARAIAALEMGMDGVVASPSEIAAIRQAVGRGLAIVTPGIRPKGGDVGDQKRVATAEDAIAAGADYLVVGRPITAASDPRRAAESLAEEIAAGMERRA